MKKHSKDRNQQHTTERGTRLYRAIDGIDEKWTRLADDPSVTLARPSSARKRRAHRHTPSLATAVCALLLLLLAAELLTAAAIYSAPLTVSETFAREYSELYSDATDGGTYTELLAYREEVTLFLRQYDKVTKAARSGKIALSEYRDYMDRYHYLEPRVLSLDRFVTYTTYLRGIETERGTEVQVLYRSMWERFFGRDRFPFLIASLFVSACLIAFLTRRHSPSRKRRTVSAFAIGAIVSLVLSVSELLLFLVLCRPDGISASIVSLECFSTLPSVLTIGSYLVLRILLTVLLSSIVTALLSSLLVRLPIPHPTSQKSHLSKGEMI